MLEIADDDTTFHMPVIDQGEDCICLVVIEAPIKIYSLIDRFGPTVYRPVNYNLKEAPLRLI